MQKNTLWLYVKWSSILDSNSYKQDFHCITSLYYQVFYFLSLLFCVFSAFTHFKFSVQTSCRRISHLSCFEVSLPWGFAYPLQSSPWRYFRQTLSFLTLLALLKFLFKVHAILSVLRFDWCLVLLQNSSDIISNQLRWPPLPWVGPSLGFSLVLSILITYFVFSMSRYCAKHFRYILSLTSYTKPMS